MKNTISIILTLGTLLLFSCKNEKAQIKKNPFEFKIEGEVKNGDGIVLALYIPSKGMDNRIKSTITNGKYIFRGKFENIEQAIIYMENQLANIGNPRWAFPVFLEPIEQKINFTIYPKKFGNSFINWSKNEFILEASNTKFSHENYINFFQAKHSSRLELLKAYDSLFKNTEYKAAQLNYLSVILNQRNFEAKELSFKEKEKINYLFTKIDTSLFETPEYNNLKSKIHIINKDTNIEIKFKDFTLLNTNNKNIKLSEIVKNNKFTVLDFWWSGCSPCRKFNRETTSEKYNSIKEQGIELISINTDRSEKNWRSSSKEDNITWVNLYSGNTSEIINHYEVKKYPKKLVFDNQFNIIDFEFIEATELLKLKNIK